MTKKPPEPVSAIQARKALNERVERLNELHSKLVRQIAELMATSSRGQAPVALDDPALAVAYTDGSATELDFTALPNAKEAPAARLQELLRHSRAAEKAINALNDRNVQLQGPVLAELMAASGVGWREITRRRAQALLELRAANEHARAFTRNFEKTLGGKAYLICSFLEQPRCPVFGPPQIDDRVYSFLNECLKHKIISKSEFEAAALGRKENQ
jgi:hypothetical protein